uniref:Uncharacterized protein n=1 Tax=Arundo donax TaxID=35708 RepID=A0A0A9H3E2_ARUDO
MNSSTLSYAGYHFLKKKIAGKIRKHKSSLHD